MGDNWQIDENGIARKPINIGDGAGQYLKVPVLTTVQRNALTATNGMIIYNSDTSQFEIYQAGAWTRFSYHAYCYAYRSAALSIPTGASFIDLDAEDYDNSGMHDNVINPTRITVPRDAIYEITASVSFNYNAAGSIRGIQLFINGVFQTATFVPQSVGTESLIKICYIARMSAGQYVEMKAYQDTGVAIALNVGRSRVYLQVLEVGDG